MIPQEIIRSKRNGQVLSKAEIDFFISGMTAGNIPDYQVSAWLMAIYFQGMSSVETSYLLNAMIESGTRYKWDATQRNSGLFVDKHSTGGVGDKTSLIILPLLVAEGLHVPMIAGRGLGHTGGTLDKLEAVPGMSTQLSAAKFADQVMKFGGAFGAQTQDFVPADKKLYALRDVTSTVESIPLIVASIMSKKLGEGLDALVLDVKYGSGSFMGTLAKAKELGNAMKAVGRAAGCSVDVALTSMEQPLGKTAGHTLEVLECIEIMQGKKLANDTRELSLQLAARIVSLAHKQDDPVYLQKTLAQMEQNLDNGTALEIFHKILIEQGADADCLMLKKTDWIASGTQKYPIYANQPGKVQAIDTRSLGLSLLELGGGRKKTDDLIHPGVGFSDFLKIGEDSDSSLKPLCFVHAASKSDFEKVKASVQAAFVVNDQAVDPQSSILIHSWV